MNFRTPVRIGERRNKYNAKKVQLDGYTFDSKKEANRYLQLCMMQRSGYISDLRVHPELEIKINRKVVCAVQLDFCYKSMSTGEVIWEDVKGKDNQLSKLKRSLVEAEHSIKVSLIKDRRQRRTR